MRILEALCTMYRPDFDSLIFRSIPDVFRDFVRLSVTDHVFSQIASLTDYLLYLQDKSKVNPQKSYLRAYYVDQYKVFCGNH